MTVYIYTFVCDVTSITLVNCGTFTLGKPIPLLINANIQADKFGSSATCKIMQLQVKSCSSFLH